MSTKNETGDIFSLAIRDALRAGIVLFVIRLITRAFQSDIAWRKQEAAKNDAGKKDHAASTSGSKKKSK